MKTIVVFRCWENGDVIALFPEEPADNLGIYCNSYEHIGQHGAAQYSGVVKATRPARLESYKGLAKELSSYPYNYELDIRKRASSKNHSIRYNKTNNHEQ